MRRLFTVGVAGTLLVIALSLSMAGWALYERFEQTQARREQQALFNTQLRRQALENCREIEKLKTSQRAEAEKRFDDLDRNLRLLGLRKTPELVATARRERDIRVARFKPEPCPRPAQNAP